MKMIRDAVAQQAGFRVQEDTVRAHVEEIVAPRDCRSRCGSPACAVASAVWCWRRRSTFTNRAPRTAPDLIFDLLGRLDGGGDAVAEDLAIALP